VFTAATRNRYVDPELRPVTVIDVEVEAVWANGTQDTSPTLR
jgi:hypothetical protein